LPSKPTESFVESDVWVTGAPAGYERVLAPPGDAKNAVVANHRDWFSEADPALQSASAFIVIGYGFNAPHIHNLVERRAENGAPVIVLTRDPSDKLDALAAKAEHVWVLTADGDGADTLDDSKTRVVNVACGDPLRMDEKLWSADVFTSHVMGD